MAGSAGAGGHRNRLGDAVLLQIHLETKIGGLMTGDAHPWVYLIDRIAGMTARHIGAARRTINLAGMA